MSLAERLAGFALVPLLSLACTSVTNEDVLLAVTERSLLDEPEFEAETPAAYRSEYPAGLEETWQALRRVASRDGRAVMAEDERSHFVMFVEEEEEENRVFSLVNAVAYRPPGHPRTTVLVQAFRLARVEHANFGVKFSYFQTDTPDASDVTGDFLASLDREMAQVEAAPR